MLLLSTLLPAHEHKAYTVDLCPHCDCKDYVNTGMDKGHSLSTDLLVSVNLWRLMVAYLTKIRCFHGRVAMLQFIV